MDQLQAFARSLPGAGKAETKKAIEELPKWFSGGLEDILNLGNWEALLPFVAGDPRIASLLYSQIRLGFSDQPGAPGRSAAASLALAPVADGNAASQKNYLALPKFQLPTWDGQPDTVGNHVDKVEAALQRLGFVLADGTPAPGANAACINLFLSSLTEQEQTAATMQALDVQQSYEKLTNWFRATRGSSELVQVYRLFKQLVCSGIDSKHPTAQQLAVQKDDLFAAIAAKCSLKGKDAGGRDVVVPLDLRQVISHYTRSDLQRHQVVGIPASFFLLLGLESSSIESDALKDPAQQLGWEKVRQAACNAVSSTPKDPPPLPIAYYAARFANGRGAGASNGGGGSRRGVKSDSEQKGMLRNGNSVWPTPRNSTDREGGGSVKGHLAKVMCYKCHELGHKAIDCPLDGKGQKGMTPTYYVSREAKEWSYSDEDDVSDSDLVPVYCLPGSKAEKAYRESLSCYDLASSQK
jgi:hypothetical protein